MIEGDAFFVVSDGSQNFFTRDGSFTVDGAGNLVMANTGYTVMGWQVDPETGDIRQDIVSALTVMHPDNLNSDPEWTTKGYVSGILDKKDTKLNSPDGLIRTMTFFDAQGYQYTAKFSFHGVGEEDRFRVQLDDILDPNGVSLVKLYGLNNIEQIASFGSSENKITTNKYTMDPNAKYDAVNNSFTINMALEEILKDFSSNAMVVAAGDSVKVTNPAAGAVSNITQGQEITVTGEVTLTKAQLESSPYNLIYDQDKGSYFMKGADGKPVEITDDTAWGNALKSMKGLESVENVKVTKGDPPENITISFDAKFEATMEAVYDGNNNFGVTLENTEANQAAILEQVYHVKDGDGKFYTIDFVGPDGSAQINMTENNKGNMIVFDSKGKFSYIGGQGQDSATLTFNSSASSMDGKNIDLTQFTNIDIDFSSINNFGNGGMSTIEMVNGSKESSTIGAGRKQGELNGIEVGQDGRITAYYDNGLTKLLGQIAVAEFANPSGLSKAGNNLYSATQNSGEFNGVGTDITANGGQMTSGVLEMSNVDLSGEFTTMITTQRGFQANSRIITVSDTLLEELVNLKR